MNKTIVALAIATLMAATANPALAGCGGSHGKSYRAAQTAKKPTKAKSVQPQNEPAAAPTTSGPDTKSGSAEFSDGASQG